MKKDLYGLPFSNKARADVLLKKEQGYKSDQAKIKRPSLVELEALLQWERMKNITWWLI